MHAAFRRRAPRAPDVRCARRPRRSAGDDPPAFVDQLDQLGRDLRAGVEQAGDWLLEGPLNLSERERDEYLDDAERSLRDSSGRIATGVLGGALLVLELVAGVALAVVITFFLLKDGDRITAWFVGLFPEGRRPELEEVGRRAWRTLAGYLRGMTWWRCSTPSSSGWRS